MSQTAVLATPLPGLPGDLGDHYTATDGDLVTAINGHASAGLVAGIAVAAAAAEGEVTPMAAAATTPFGVVLREFSDPAKLAAAGGFAPDTLMTIGRRGRFWVYIEENVAIGGDVRVRHTAAGAEIAGAFRSTADGTDCTDLTDMGARWVTAGTAGGAALLEIDFSNSSLAAADV
jgi:hypothetical protein